MALKELSNLIGKTISLYDPRTGCAYDATIDDVKSEWGKTRILVYQDSDGPSGGGSGPKDRLCDHEGYREVWFEPSSAELQSVR